MKLDDQRRVSLKIFAKRLLTVNLYDFDSSISTGEDITDLCSFLEHYEDKYLTKLITVEENNARVIFKNVLIFSAFKFIRNLEPGDFEKFSAIICKALGFSNYFASKKAHDQGVDFIAFKEYDNLKIDYKYHIIGQSKHFESMLVDVRDIRELSGSVALFSRKEFYDASDSYAQFEIGLFSPIQVIFISSYFFSNDSIALCQKANIIPLDIIDITCLCVIGMLKGRLKWLNRNGSFSYPKAKSELKKTIVLQNRNN